MNEVEIRRWSCPDCHNRFWVDCDDTDYPTLCPFCGKEQFGESENRFIKDVKTNVIEEVPL